MDIIKILTAIKGKVLDAANFDLLRSAYELQNQNIDQLKAPVSWGQVFDLESWGH